MTKQKTKKLSKDRKNKDRQSPIKTFCLLIIRKIEVIWTKLRTLRSKIIHSKLKIFWEYLIWFYLKNNSKQQILHYCN